MRKKKRERKRDRYKEIERGERKKGEKERGQERMKTFSPISVASPVGRILRSLSRAQLTTTSL